jgi:protease IV
MSEPSDSESPGAVDSRTLLRDVLSSFLDQQRMMLEERRRERLWRNVRMALLVIGMLSGPVYFAWALERASGMPSGGRYAALVRIEGIIGPAASASAARVVESLERAFKDPKALGVVVLINSPGGSPVQADLIRERLVALRREHPDKKVWAIGEDMLTSGAYFVAVGAPHICVNESTLTGSIGVIRDGWGFDRLIQRLGIDRRVFTAGTSKNRLDAFRPLTDEDRQKADELLKAVHERFKAVVREGRGDRLHASEALLFSGDMWTGTKAVELGLVDGLCGFPALLQREFGTDSAKDYTTPPGLLDGITRAIGTRAVSALEETLGSASPLRMVPPDERIGVR